MIKKILHPIEPVLVIGADETTACETRIDPGSKRASIHSPLAKELGIDDSVEEKTFKTSNGSDTRPLIEVSYVLRGEVYTTKASLKDRSELSPNFRLGRTELEGFLVDPEELV